VVFSIWNIIFTNMIKSEYNVIALMSGTSLDGVDMLYATFKKLDQWQFEIIAYETSPYSKRWASNLLGLVDKTKDELKQIDVQYSKYLGDLVNDFISKNTIENVDFIASHGHTALHEPDKGITYQIGNAQIFADTCQREVVCDFRVNDVELGGQGAPLVPIGDRLLFQDYEYCLNLGGFANISFENVDERLAFDICPVNIVLNHYVSKLNKPFDNKGLIASKGSINLELLNQLNALSYYKTEPPKSLALEWVKTNIFPLVNSFGLDVNVILRTFVEHVAIQISKAISNKEVNVLVTGGGAYNDFLIHRIKNLSVANIVIPEPKIIEYKEALIFGLLGVLRKRHEVNCLKSVTGAKRDHSSGKILSPGD
jgi:anhydro-N-acetylmuramic acid kinase